MSDDPAGPQGHGFQGHQRLGSKVALIVGSQGIGTILGYAALLAIGRYFAPEAYGSYLFALSLIGLLTTMFRLGFTQAHQREIGGGLPADLGLGVYGRIRIALTGLMVLTVVVGTWIWFGLLDRGFTDATSLEVLIIILASSVIASTRAIATDTWTAQGRVHRAEWSNTVDSAVYAATVVLLGLGIASASGRWTPAAGLGDAIAEAFGIAAKPDVMTLAVFISMGHFLGKVAGLIPALVWWLRDRTRVGPWDPALARQYRDFALPVALTGVLGLVLQHTDVLMLGYFWTSTQVGWYGAAQRLANVALLANIAIRGVLMPFFSSLYQRGEHERAMRAFRVIERFLLLAVIPLAVAMMVWAEAGLHIFVGDSFLGAAPALRWLAAWTLVAAMQLPVRAQHMAAGDTQILVRATTLNVVLNVTLNLIFIPPQMLGMGPEGAAMATFASTLAAYGYTRFEAARRHGIPWLDTAQLRMFGAGLAPLAVWIWMQRTLPETAYDRVWELAGVGVIGGIAYLVALLATRGIRRSDLDLIRTAIGPRAIWGELRGR